MLAREYHADPAPEPSLSAATAELIIRRSARHAWAAHPRNPARPPARHTDEMDEGSALHALATGSEISRIVVIDAEDWRAKAAQATRAAARAAGDIPVLARDMERLRGCIAAMREQLEAHEQFPNLSRYSAEVSLFWQRGGTWNRARPDMLSDDPTAPVLDWKFTSGSAAPADWEQHVWKTHALRAEFYLRGCEVLRGVRPEGYRFIVVETKPPHGVCIYEACGDVSAWAAEQLDVAERIWAASLETRQWRGYPRRIVHVEMPGWLLQKWQSEQAIADPPRRRPSLDAVERIHEMSARIGGPVS